MSKGLFDTLLGDIQSGNMEAVESKVAGLSEEQLNALFGEAQPFKALGNASSDKLVIGSVSNLRERYLKRLITTSMVGFLFQMKEEFTVNDEHLTTPINKDDFYEEVVAKKLPENFDMDNLFSEEIRNMYKTRFPEGQLLKFKEMEEKLSEDDLLKVSDKVNARYKELTEVEKTFNSSKYDSALHEAIESQSNRNPQVSVL